MKFSSTGVELQQILCAMQRKQFGIFEILKLICPSADLLEIVYARRGKEKRLSPGRLLLRPVELCEEYDGAFNPCKNA